MTKRANLSELMEIFSVATALVVVVLGSQASGEKKAASPALDLEGEGWQIQRPYNTVRHADGRLFPTVEQGKWHPPRLVPRPDAANDRALWYGVPESEEIKDRVETILVREVPVGVTCYSAFDVRFPKDLPKVAEDGWFLFHQWHQSSPESPPLALEIKPGTNDVFQISYRYTAEDGRQRRRLHDHPLPLGQWLRFLVKWHFDPAGKGEARVWLDGKEVFAYRGRLGFSDVKDQKIDEKFGIYRKGARSSAELLYDNLRFGTDWKSVTDSSFPLELRDRPFHRAPQK